MRHSRLLMLTIWALLLTALTGCATQNKESGYQLGVDYIPFEKGAEMGKAPERGAFLSDRFYKYQFGKCNP